MTINKEFLSTEIANIEAQRKNLIDQVEKNSNTVAIIDLFLPTLKKELEALNAKECNVTEAA